MTNHEGHIKLWDELAKTGSPSKGTTKTYMVHRPPNGCFACVEAGYSEDEDGVITEDCCPNCPIDWGVERIFRRCTCEIDGSPYRAWMYEPEKEERKRLAAIIRDLPWREK